MFTRCPEITFVSTVISLNYVRIKIFIFFLIKYISLKTIFTIVILIVIIFN